MKWELLHPDQEQAEDVPCKRAAFGGMLSYNGCVYLFGGIKVMYGRPKGPGDLSVQGSLNDLWRYDPGRGRWTRLEDHDGRIGFSPSDARPCTRKLTTWLPVNGRLYLFGGSSVRGPGKGADQAERSLGLRSEDSLVGADRARRRARIRNNGGWASSRRVGRDGGGRSG